MSRNDKAQFVANFTDELRDLVRHSPEVVVLVHVPKTAGSAFGATARAAGWACVNLDHFNSMQGRCSTCYPRRCDRERLWHQSLTLPDPRGVFVSVGHRPLHVGRTVLSALADQNPNIRLMMTVRPAQARLESLFRFVWQLSLEARGENLAKTYSGSLVRSGGSLGRLARTWLTLSTRALASTHQERTRRDTALALLCYGSSEQGKLRIDAGAWLESFSKQGSAYTYWMHDFCDPTDLRRSVANGSVELVRNRSINAVCESLFGTPALRTNVSSDAPHPEVVRAINGAKRLFERHAERDAAFEDLMV